MHSLRTLLLFSVTGLHALHAQAHSRPLPVGFFRADGIVTVAFIVTDSAIRPIQGDETFVPDGLAPRWTIVTRGAAPFDVRAGAMVHVVYDVASGKLPLVGQVTAVPRASDFDYHGDRHDGVAFGRSVPAGVFHRYSSPSPPYKTVLPQFLPQFLTPTP